MLESLIRSDLKVHSGFAVPGAHRRTALAWHKTCMQIGRCAHKGLCAKGWRVYSLER